MEKITSDFYFFLCCSLFSKSSLIGKTRTAQCTEKGEYRREGDLPWRSFGLLSSPGTGRCRDTVAEKGTAPPSLLRVTLDKSYHLASIFSLGNRSGGCPAGVPISGRPL